MIDDEKKKKSIQIDKETWKKLKIISLNEEVTINEIIQNLTSRYFLKMKYQEESIFSK